LRLTLSIPRGITFEKKNISSSVNLKEFPHTTKVSHPQTSLKRANNVKSDCAQFEFFFPFCFIIVLFRTEAEAAPVFFTCFDLIKNLKK
jgi:hypothetical protein